MVRDHSGTKRRAVVGHLIEQTIITAVGEGSGAHAQRLRIIWVEIATGSDVRRPRAQNSTVNGPLGFKAALHGTSMIDQGSSLKLALGLVNAIELPTTPAWPLTRS